MPPRRRPSVFLRRLRRRPIVAAALMLLAAFIAVALVAPLVSPNDPYALIPGAVLRPPSLQFPFGTDELGRDILSRIIHGTRISLQIGTVTVAI
ncbi:MAG TPA: peptide ABC transporter permease, partial [bacterium]|nr:peptide ABC transporter permease [bacterium]